MIYLLFVTHVLIPSTKPPTSADLVRDDPELLGLGGDLGVTAAEAWLEEMEETKWQKSH